MPTSALQMRSVSNQLTSLTFAIAMAITIAAIVLTVLLVRNYNRRHAGQKVKRQAEAFRWPVGTTLSILGLLIPAFSAILAYLYLNYPNQSFGFLYASIVVLFIVLMVGCWLTFSFLSVTKEGDIIEIVWPDNRHVVTGGALLYILLSLGIAFFAAFLLCELPTPQKETIVNVDQVSMRIRDIAQTLYPRENPDDIWTMVDILSTQRSAARGQDKPSSVETIRSAGFLCVLFQPMKVEAYSDAARECREAFAGIHSDDHKQKVFELALTPEVIGIERIGEAVELGFDSLFDRDRYREFLR